MTPKIHEDVLDYVERTQAVIVAMSRVFLRWLIS
jgi:hypothetical protein